MIVAAGLKNKPTSSGPDNELSPEEMLQVDIIEYAWELRVRRALSLRDIAKELKEKYNLPILPTHGTVANWLRKCWTFKTDNVANYEEQLKNELYAQQQEILQRWLPVALGEDIQILRTKVVNGNTVTYMDEDAIPEQLKAAELILKTHGQICKTMGVDKSQMIDLEDLTPTRMLQIVMNVSQYVNLPSSNGTPIDIEASAQRLELESGVPEIDGL